MKPIVTSIAASRVLAAVLALVCPLFNWAGTASDQSLTCTEMEEFLRLGKIGAQKDIPKGVTLPRRATLEYKGTQHDAAIQTVDISRAAYHNPACHRAKFPRFLEVQRGRLRISQDPGTQYGASLRGALGCRASGLTLVVGR